MNYKEKLKINFVDVGTSIGGTFAADTDTRSGERLIHPVARHAVI
jgi:hypothetical protein